MPHHLPLEFILAGGLLCLQAQCSALSQQDVDLYAKVIYRVEGGAGTSFPFGVKCHRHSFSEAEKICKNTIRNNYARWEKLGKKGNFLNFLADKYCPPSSDPLGNRRWKKNFSSILLSLSAPSRAKTVLNTAALTTEPKPLHR